MVTDPKRKQWKRQRRRHMAEQRRVGRGLPEKPDRNRSIVLLHDLAGWTFREIGEAMGISGQRAWKVYQRDHERYARRL